MPPKISASSDYSQPPLDMYRPMDQLYNIATQEITVATSKPQPWRASRFGNQNAPNNTARQQAAMENFFFSDGNGNWLRIRIPSSWV